MQHLQPNTPLQGGKYRIERVLGQGGFGITYVGYNTEFEETVAIKEFFMKGVTERDESTRSVCVSNAENVPQFEEQREKFKKEARRLRKLKNEHIVKVHDLFEENGTAYYVMEYIEGESLAERMKRVGRPLAEQEVMSILHQILDALGEVHQNEIWHLDLKPGNVMLDKQGNAYLIDFGASKQIRADGSFTTSTALCYTPGYAPNEQIGQMYDRFGPWTDFYALGATIYSLLTNKQPPMAIDIEEDEEDAFSFPDSVSTEMRSLVIWMMQPKRKDRPQSVEEILNKINGQFKSNRAEETLPVKPCNESHLTTNISQPLSEATVILDSSNAENDDIEREILTASGIEDPLMLHENESKVSFNLPNDIQEGNFVHYDGTYSDKLNSESVIGVVFSKYGSSHGALVSVSCPQKHITINGTNLKWREASLSDWIRIIETLGHYRVIAYPNGSYVFYPADKKLHKYQIDEHEYVTRKDVNGFSYIVNLVEGSMVILNKKISLPFLYVADF